MKTVKPKTENRAELRARAERILIHGGLFDRLPDFDLDVDVQAESVNRSGFTLRAQIDKLIDKLVTDDDPSLINNASLSPDTRAPSPELVFVNWEEPEPEPEPEPDDIRIVDSERELAYWVKAERSPSGGSWECWRSPRAGETGAERIGFKHADYSLAQYQDAFALMLERGGFDSADFAKLRRHLIHAAKQAQGEPEPEPVFDHSEPRSFAVGENTGGSLKYLSSDELRIHPYSEEKPPAPLWGLGDNPEPERILAERKRSDKAPEPIGHIGASLPPHTRADYVTFP